MGVPSAFVPNPFDFSSCELGRLASMLPGAVLGSLEVSDTSNGMAGHIGCVSRPK